MSSTPKFFPKVRGWSRILLLGGCAGGVSAVLLSVLGAIFGGGAAAGSAALGAVTVLVLSAASILVAEIGDRVAPDLTIMLFLAAFALKLILLGVLLIAVPMPGWMEPLWAGISAMTALIIWQIAAVAGFRSMRMPLGAS